MSWLLLAWVWGHAPWAQAVPARAVVRGVPVAMQARLSAAQARAASMGRLEVRGPGGARAAAQWEPAGTGGTGVVRWMAGPGAPAPANAVVGIAPRPSDGVRAALDPSTGQVEVREGAARVLRYNAATVEPGDLLQKVSESNRIYARARSNYIHPLYGPHGEVLTRDWPIDHPHHRGIYWAWPEVMFGEEMGDLHALQRVFARPVATPKLTSGPVYARVRAESEWRWEDRIPIAREVAILTIYRASGEGRLIDLEFRITALKDGVTVARRGTSHYGGLNIRLAPVTEQSIATHTDPPSAAPRMAWAELHGTFEGSAAPAGLVVFQHAGNPEYPGDWVQFPEINWFQPTFPTAGTRYPLRQDVPLVLRYRLWVHDGPPAASAACTEHWRAYHADAAPAPHRAK